MTDRPILFSDPMVRALFAGTKTQTRRIIDFPGNDKVAEFVRIAFDKDTDVPIYEMKDAAGKFLTRPAGKHFVDYHYSPRFAVGDRLWVREAWRCNGWATDVATVMYRASEGHGYTAMTEQYPVVGKQPLRVTATWRPGIHMPRWASRLTLTVTDVRVERLQEISEADAVAEGAEVCRLPGMDGGLMVHTDNPGVTVTPGRWYRQLWDGLNAERGYGWDANPWVIAITFAVDPRNIDEAKPWPC